VFLVFLLSVVVVVFLVFLLSVVVVCCRILSHVVFGCLSKEPYKRDDILQKRPITRLNGVYFSSCVGVCYLMLSYGVFWCLFFVLSKVVFCCWYVVVFWCLFFVLRRLRVSFKRALQKRRYSAKETYDLSCLMFSFGVFFVLGRLWCPFRVLSCRMVS